MFIWFFLPCISSSSFLAQDSIGSLSAFCGTKLHKLSLRVLSVTKSRCNHNGSAENERQKGEKDTSTKFLTLARDRVAWPHFFGGVCYVISRWQPLKKSSRASKLNIALLMTLLRQIADNSGLIEVLYLSSTCFWVIQWPRSQFIWGFNLWCVFLCGKVVINY